MGMKRLGCLAMGAGFLAALSMAAPANAASFTLTDENSSLLFDTESEENLLSWIVEGTNQLDSLGYWYRIGDGPEQSVSATLTQVSANSVDTNGDGGLDRLFVEYVSPDLFDISFTYGLEGGEPGSLRSLFNTAIEVENLSASALDFNLFAFSDFNLNNSPSFDTLTVSRDPNTGLVTAEETFSGGPAVATLTTNPGADRYDTDQRSTLLSLLNDGNADDLALTDGAETSSSNSAFAFQFERSIDSGTSVLVGQTNFVRDVQPIPEPTSTLGLLALGAFGGGSYFKRWRKQKVEA